MNGNGAEYIATTVRGSVSSVSAQPPGGASYSRSRLLNSVAVLVPLYEGINTLSNIQDVSIGQTILLNPHRSLILDVAPQPGDGFLALAVVETPGGVIRLAAPLTHEEFEAIKQHPSLGAELLSNLSQFEN